MKLRRAFFIFSFIPALFLYACSSGNDISREGEAVSTAVPDTLSDGSAMTIGQVLDSTVSAVGNIMVSGKAATAPPRQETASAYAAQPQQAVYRYAGSSDATAPVSGQMEGDYENYGSGYGRGSDMADNAVTSIQIIDAGSISVNNNTNGSASTATVSQNVVVTGRKFSGKAVPLKKGMGGKIALPNVVEQVADAPGEASEVQPEEQTPPLHENEFRLTGSSPFSTFSIDVDAASYTNTRRYVADGLLPPPDAVRIEEFLNYFTYDYEEPKGRHPFSFTTETADCPWNPEHRLVHIGLQGKRIARENIPPGNLVFLIDVSGSMHYSNKLDLLKKAFRLLVDELRPEDRVAVVVYAGAAGLVLPSTPGSNKQTIVDAIDRLSAGGSTAGGEGIRLAYDIARRAFIPGGNNRVILATDGDFNVGISDQAGLVKLIEEKRHDGVFLSVLGFGRENFQDRKMEQLADNGNGNYYYIDTEHEAERVLVKEMGATLFTIAKDVKLQIEFNPAKVKAYRLIGYENRMLAARDFADDTKDAGELGAGHSVTAVYEVVPVGAEIGYPVSEADSADYQLPERDPALYGPDDLMVAHLRYKQPDSEISTLLEHLITDKAGSLETASDNFKFSAAVAELGLLLRNSRYRKNATYADVLRLATEGLGNDPGGYRTEFLKLVAACANLAGEAPATTP